MAGVKISALPSVSAVTASDVIPIVQAGVTSKVAASVALPYPVTWTPTIVGLSTGGTQTYSIQQGYGIHLGTGMLLQANINMSGLDGSSAGNMAITGLPAPANAGISTSFPIVVFNVDLNVGGAYYTPVGSILAGESQIRLQQTGDNVVLANIAAAAMTATSGLRICAWYPI